jgi:hypothetical protein
MDIFGCLGPETLRVVKRAVIELFIASRQSTLLSWLVFYLSSPSISPVKIDCVMPLKP